MHGVADLTEDGVDRVHGDLVLGGVTDETLRVGEADVRRRRSVTLVVGDDLDAVMLPNADARVRRSEIDSDRWSLSFSGHYGLAGCVVLRRRERGREERSKSEDTA